MRSKEEPTQTGPPAGKPPEASWPPASLLRQMLDSTREGVFSMDPNGRCTFLNRAAAETLGFRPEELLGSNIHGFICGCSPVGSASPMPGCPILNAAGTEDEPAPRVRKFQRRDGTSVLVEYVTRPIDGEGEAHGAVVTFTDPSGGTESAVRDFTERGRAQEEIRELHATARDRTLLLDTVHRVALDILTASETGVEALRHLVEAARTLTGAREAAITVDRPYQHGLPPRIAAGLPQAEAGPGRQTEVESPREGHLSTSIARGDAVLGTLRLSHKLDGGAFTEADAAILSTLGSHAAVAMHHLHLLARQRTLVGQLIEAEEEERRRVAYELHDGLTQYVMAAHAHLEAFRQANRTDKQERAARELSQGLHYLKDAVIESRRLVNGLRPLALDDLGLVGALEQLLGEEKERAGWEEATLAHNIPDRRFDGALETAAYRVAQEALTNARRHAAAARVHVELFAEEEGRAEGPRLSLEVRDWGQGFLPEPGAVAHGHVGLHAMRERVARMEGTCDVLSVPGEGTVVCAVFPVRSGSKAAEEQGDE